MDYLIEISNLTAYLQKFVGKTVDELLDNQKVVTKAKSKNYILSLALSSSYKGKKLFFALLEHENLHLKTIQLKDNGKPKEAMSFSPFDFNEICRESWENSKFKEYIDGRFLFFVFKKEKGVNFLQRVFMWKMPDADKSGVKDVWTKTRDLLLSGNVIKRIDDKNKVITTFPAESETKICHIRPHGKDGADLKEIPVQDVNTGYKFLSKQSFWFNHSYIEKIVQYEED